MDVDYQLELGNLIYMVILHFDYVDFPFVENQVISVVIPVKIGPSAATGTNAITIGPSYNCNKTRHLVWGCPYPKKR